MHKSTWGTSLVIINVDVIPDTFHRRTQLIPPKQVRVPYLRKNSIPGLHWSPLHANPIQPLEYDEAADDEEEDCEEMNPSAWPATSDGVEQEVGSAPPARARARKAASPCPGAEGGSGRRRGRQVCAEGSLLCAGPLLAGWSDGRRVGAGGRARRSSGERGKRRNVLPLIRSR